MKEEKKVKKVKKANTKVKTTKIQKLINLLNLGEILLIAIPLIKFGVIMIITIFGLKALIL